MNVRKAHLVVGGVLGSIGGLAIVGLVAAIFWGYISNIVSLAGMSFANPIGMELVLRIVGIFLAPIGVVMGYI